MVIYYGKCLYYTAHGMARRLAVRVFLLGAFLLWTFAAPCFAKKKPPLHPINLNTATALELQ